jgi:hypothetical protein
MLDTKLEPFLITKRYRQTGNIHVEQVFASSKEKLKEIIAWWNYIGSDIWEIAPADVELKS